MIVVDASVALAWTLADTDENHRYAAWILELRDEGETLVVPGPIFTTEVAYVLLKRGRKDKEGQAMIAERAEFIDQEFHLRTRASTMVRYAVRHNVQGFDAVYLGLAEHLGAKLATLDGGLRTAASNAGIVLV